MRLLNWFRPTCPDRAVTGGLHTLQSAHLSLSSTSKSGLRPSTERSPSHQQKLRTPAHFPDRSAGCQRRTQPSSAHIFGACFSHCSPTPNQLAPLLWASGFPDLSRERPATTNGQLRPAEPVWRSLRRGDPLGSGLASDTQSSPRFELS